VVARMMAVFVIVIERRALPPAIISVEHAPLQ
jgi:hypothetical protein